MKFQLKYLVLPTLLTTLAGCDSDSNNNNNSANSAPVLSMPEMLETEHSTYQEVYDVATDKNVMQAQYTFQESDTFGAGVETYDIDLLKGFTDADGQPLTINNFTYVWVGPDCSDTIVAAANYPEICEPILTPLGFEIGQTDLIFDDRELIRKAQNNPITDDILYGFKLKQTVLSVTPKEFIPVLYQGERSVVNFSFDVTDGIDTVKHYIYAEVVGENVAPEFLVLKADGSPVLDDDGNVTPLAPRSVPLSEKDAAVTVSLHEGLYDKDVYQNAEIAREIGNLDDYYVWHSDTSYAEENLIFPSVLSNPANVTFDGVTWPGSISDIASEIEIRDPITDKVIGRDLTFHPSKFADQLARGEVGTVTFNYKVTDGNNAGHSIERTVTFEVTGANLTNEPIFSEAVLAKTITTEQDIQTIDLLEGIQDLDGDPMEIIDIVAPPEAAVFGFTITDSSITLDPYAFLYLAPGETEVFEFTYKATDGTLTSAERTLELTFEGANVNLVKDGTFEDGTLGANWKTSNVTGQEDAAGVAVNADSAYTGNFGVETLTNDVGIRLGADGITQGEIASNDSFYVSWQSKSRPVAEGGTGAFTNIVVTIKNALNDANIYDPVFSTMRGLYTQTLHTADFLPDNFFNDETPIELKLSAKSSVTYDDVRIVKYRSTEARNLVKGNDGHFNNGTAANWVMSDAGASIAITEDANSDDSATATRYGLELTSGANWNAVRLLPAGINQGTFKKGIRYVVEFDFQNTGAVASNLEALELKLIDATSGNFLASPKNRISKSTTEWQDLRFHFVTDTDSEYFNPAKPLASDPTFDWSLADDVRLEIVMPPNVTFNIDNVRIYPVPE